MTRRVFSDVDEMLDPNVLTAIIGSDVSGIAREPIVTEGFSDNLFERVTCRNVGGDDVQLVLKRFDQSDWIAALTSDTRFREISLLEEGWYGRLPPECQAPMLAATRGASGSSILMRDVSNALFPPGDDLECSNRIGTDAWSGPRLLPTVQDPRKG